MGGDREFSKNQSNYHQTIYHTENPVFKQFGDIWWTSCNILQLILQNALRFIGKSTTAKNGSGHAGEHFWVTEQKMINSPKN